MVEITNPNSFGSSSKIDSSLTCFQNFKSIGGLNLQFLLTRTPFLVCLDHLRLASVDTELSPEQDVLGLIPAVFYS